MPRPTNQLTPQRLRTLRCLAAAGDAGMRVRDYGTVPGVQVDSKTVRGLERRGFARIEVGAQTRAWITEAGREHLAGVAAAAEPQPPAQAS